MNNMVPISMIAGKGKGLSLGLMSVVAVLVLVAIKKRQAGGTAMVGASGAATSDKTTLGTS